MGGRRHGRGGGGVGALPVYLGERGCVGVCTHANRSLPSRCPAAPWWYLHEEADLTERHLGPSIHVIEGGCRLSAPWPAHVAWTLRLLSTSRVALIGQINSMTSKLYYSLGYSDQVAARSHALVAQASCASVEGRSASQGGLG